MRRFLRDRGGNIAILFSLALIPVLGALGAAVDYSLAASYRTDLQKALDATGLALAKLMPLGQDALNTKAQQYFGARA